MKSNKIKLSIIHCNGLLFLCILICNMSQSNAQKLNGLPGLVYNIRFNLSIPGDTLFIKTGSVSINRSIGETFMAIRDFSGIFKFVIPTNYNCGYLHILKARPTRKNDHKFLAKDLFWEQGDSIFVDITENIYPEMPLHAIAYSGRGSAKYVANELLSHKTIELVNKFKENDFFYEILTDTLHWPYRKIEAQEKILDEFKHSMTPLSYNILKVNYRMTTWNDAMFGMKNNYQEELLNEDSSVQTVAANRLRELFMPMRSWGIDDLSLANSIEYIKFYNDYFLLYSQLSKGKYNVDDIYRNIVDSSTGNVRQALLILLLNDIGNASELFNIYDSVGTYLTDRGYITEFENLKAKNTVNLSAYTFVDTNGNTVRIEDFRDKLILIDTWWTGCPGCAYYYKNVISKVKDHFEDDKRFVILSISSDKSIDGWKTGISSNLYTDERAVNLYTNGLGMKHPMYMDLGIISGPTAIIVDSKGDILDFNSRTLMDYDLLIKKIERNLQ